MTGFIRRLVLFNRRLSQDYPRGIEDAHEVVFQTEPPKYQYRCFLESFLNGVPRVPAPGGLDDACE